MTQEAFLPVIRSLALLIAANATPVIVARLARGRWTYPLDCGCKPVDGDELLSRIQQLLAH